MFDVICIGSALLDIFLKSPQFKKVPNGEFQDGVALCEEYGGKTEVSEVVVASGGAGTNNAVSYARKGLRTALIAEVGQDLIASTIKEELSRENVDLSMLSEVQGEETGCRRFW
jgi:ribokinase